MKRLTIITSALVFFLLIFAYWYSGVYAAKTVVEAYSHGNTAAVDEAINWDELAPSLGKTVASSFIDSGGASLEQFITSSSRLIYLTRPKNESFTARIEIIAEGFTNINEYTLSTGGGNKIVLRLHGVRWLVDRISLTTDHAKALAVYALSTAHKEASFVLHNKDIYFDDPKYGCRLTTTSDIVNFAIAPDGKKIVYARLITPPDGAGYMSSSHSQLWSLGLPNTKIQLLLNGKWGENPGESTEFNASLALSDGLAFSNDSRLLYFDVLSGVVSDAIVEFSFQTGKTRFITGGNLIQVIKQGRYAGDIIISKHGYYPQGGSHDWTYVVDPNGVELFSSNKEFSNEEWKSFLFEIENTPATQ